MTSSPVRLLLGALPFLLGAVIPAAAVDSANLAPNPDFTKGSSDPSGWRVASGTGRWVERTLLQIEGTGHGAECWQSTPIRFEPGRAYRFEAKVRRLGGTGSIIAGPEFANRDYGIPTGGWQRISHVFRVPAAAGPASVRLGVWDSSGTVQFDTVRVVPVQPVYQAQNGLMLGAGESIHDGRYTFSGTYGNEGSNDHRPFVRHLGGLQFGPLDGGRPGQRSSIDSACPAMLFVMRR